MTVYFRSPTVVITDRLIRVRVPGGWRVWVITEMSDFGIIPASPPRPHGVWAFGASAIAVGVVAVQYRPAHMIVVVPVLLVALGVSVIRRRRMRERARAQLWATYRGTLVLVFELPERDFGAACRGLRRVLDHHEDTR